MGDEEGLNRMNIEWLGEAMNTGWLGGRILASRQRKILAYINTQRDRVACRIERAFLAE